MNLTLDNTFTVIVFLTVVPIIALWTRDAWRQYARSWEPSEEKIIDCPRCQYSFLVRPRRQASTCPACQEHVRVRLSKSKHIKY